LNHELASINAELNMPAYRISRLDGWRNVRAAAQDAGISVHDDPDPEIQTGMCLLVFQEQRWVLIQIFPIS
jgi:hypothetical protein